MPSIEQVIEHLSGELRQRSGPRQFLQWIKASVGSSVKLIPVEQVVYLRADEKYTLVVWEGGEALIRKTIRELADELDPERFAQVHRSVIVNLHEVSQVNRGPNETAEIQLKGRREMLPVSRSFVPCGLAKPDPRAPLEARFAVLAAAVTARGMRRSTFALAQPAWRACL